MKSRIAYIIAAGDGSRLMLEGCKYKKPLVPLSGVPLIERLINILDTCEFQEINIITNSNNDDVVEYIDSLSDSRQLNINILQISTPSSMHSLYELLKNSNHFPFYLFTVDTVFSPLEFEKYIEYCENNEDKFEAVMAVTGYIDDEKPLYIQTEKDRIIAFLDENDNCELISSGMYYFNTDILDLLDKQIKIGTHKLRNFQRSLIYAGMSVGYYKFSKTIDVDHVEDINKAQNFIKEVL